MLTFVASFVFLAQTGNLLRLFGISAEVAEDTQFFVTTSIPTIFFHLLFDCNRQYLNATHQSTIVFYAFTVATLLHSFWCYLFILHLDLGIMGAAFANLIHAFSCFIITAVYLSFKAIHTIPFFSIVPGTFDLDYVRSYIAIGMPSIALICLEWWGFEVMVLMSGVFSSTAVAAQTVSFNLMVLMLMVPHGLFNAGITICGNSIGEMDV